MSGLVLNILTDNQQATLFGYLLVPCFLSGLEKKVLPLLGLVILASGLAFLSLAMSQERTPRDLEIGQCRLSGPTNNALCNNYAFIGTHGQLKPKEEHKN